MATDYPLENFTCGDIKADARLREAATSYAYNIQKGKVATDGIGKVILVGITGERKVEDFIGVLRYSHPLNNDPNANALPTPHARYVGETHEALRELGRDRGWDLDALDAVYDKTVAADYRFAGVWAKPKLNPDRSCAVGIEWRTDQRIALGFTVTPKGGKTQWVPFLTSSIGLGKIDAAAGKLVWQDAQHALLWHKNKRDYWLLNVQSLDVEFVYKPAADGNPHGQYQLAQMYLEGNQWVEKDSDKARLWLEKSAAQGFARAKSVLAKM